MVIRRAEIQPPARTRSAVEIPDTLLIGLTGSAQPGKKFLDRPIWCSHGVYLPPAPYTIGSWSINPFTKVSPSSPGACPFQSVSSLTTRSGSSVRYERVGLPGNFLSVTFG